VLVTHVVTDGDGTRVEAVERHAPLVPTPAPR
jgi:hypothetical protein